MFEFNDAQLTMAIAISVFDDVFPDEPTNLMSPILLVKYR